MYHHIKNLLVLTGMKNYTTMDNPDIQTMIGPDIYGAHCKEYGNKIYAAAVRIINYLSTNSWLDINNEVSHWYHQNNNLKL